jgi:hypothetical protein
MMVDFELLAARLQEPLDSAPYDRWPCPTGSDYLLFYRTSDRYILRFSQIADFEIAEDGLRVACTPVPDIPEAITENLYLNQVLPLILSSKGKLVLHGSAVDAGGSAIAFLGASRRGKSTLAAAFAVAGCPFLADDSLVLELTDLGYLVIPNHPSIRLWKDSEDALLTRDKPATRAVHHMTKSRFVASSKLGYCDQPRPLRAIYFLGLGQAEDVAIRRVDPVPALASLMQHSFILDVDDHPGLGAHFGRLATLADEVTCFHLDFPKRYENLPTFLRAIRAHAFSEGARP